MDEYIAGFPRPVRTILEEVRRTIRTAAPDAVEGISYAMPAYTLGGVLVYFAGFKKHVGFYPRTSGIAKFKKELAAYQGEKGSVQFPLDEPMPLELIERIVRFRVQENRAKAKTG